MHHLVKPAQLVLKNGDDRITVRPLTANAGDPVMCRTWDLGSPDVRYMSVPNPGADGVTESAGYLGSRQVTLDLQILGDIHSEPDDPLNDETTHDAYWYVSKLTKMAHPSATPELHITRGDELTAGKTWMMALRGNPYSLAFGQKAGAVIELQLTFVCPLGMLESGLLSYSASANTTGARTDWIFPATFPKGFGLVGASYPQLVIPVGGDAAVTPTIYIAGPVKNPDIRSGDDRFKFNGLTLTEGQAVQIDMGTGDIRLGRADSGEITDDMSAYNYVDWSVSTYWVWQPGLHTVRYYSMTGSITVQFSERRLTI